MTSDAILLDDFIDEHVVKTVKQFKDLPDKLVHLFIDILSRMAFDVNGKKYLIKQDAINALKNFAIALEERDFSFLYLPRGLKVDRVVDVEEFANSRQYLGLKGTIRPSIMEHLWNIFHSDYSDYYIEVVVGGAIGIGKSFLAKVAAAYILYRLSCYYSPQLEYGLAPGSSIEFIFQSIKLEQAKKVLFDQFYEWIKNSPYFMENFAPDPYTTTELRFPSNIRVFPLSSSDTAALGFNVYCAVLDELNFMAKVEDSVRVPTPSGGEYDQAERLYASVMRRMKSRFQSYGKTPGKVFLLSSANYRGDFIDKKRQEYEDLLTSNKIPTMYVVWMSQWEARDRSEFSDEIFYVEVGDETKQSRILKDKSEAINPDDVIEVPMDFYDDFERDLDAALRDLAGIPVGGVNSFIKHRQSLEEAVSRHETLFNGVQLFAQARVDTAYAPPIDDLINWDYIENELRVFGDDNLVRDSFFTLHIDMGLVHDSCGIAVSRLAGFTEVEKAIVWSEELKRNEEVRLVEYPNVIVDGVIELVPPPSDDIDLQFVCALVEKVVTNLNVVWVTSDAFQSAYILQFVRKLRNASGRYVKTAKVSTDASIAPYAELRQALRDGRIIFPRIDKLLKELRGLQYDPKRNKIDHPAGGSKDLADAVASSAYVIFNLFGPGKKSPRLIKGKRRSRRSRSNRRPISTRQKRRKAITSVRL